MPKKIDKTASKGTKKGKPGRSAGKILNPEVIDGEILDPEEDPAAEQPEEELDAIDVEGFSENFADDADELAADGDEPANRDSNRSLLPARTAGTTLPVPAGRATGLDALDLYLKELRKYPILSKEEERELAIKFSKSKDKEALYKLVTSNLWLAVKIARDYEKAARNLMDLVQEGNMGLLEAVKNFDPYRDVRLPSYAVWWIKAYIIRYLINNWRMVKIGTTQAQRKLFFNLNKERERLEKEGFTPSAQLIADRLNVKESEVTEMQQRMGSSDLSVDAPLPNDTEANLLSLIPAEQATAEDLLEKREFQEMLQKSMLDFRERLNPKEKAIFEERLLDEDKSTLHDLSVKLSISKERVRQIEERIKEKLKVFMLDNFKVLVDEWRV